MDWTKEKAEQAEATLRKWRSLTAGVVPASNPLPEVVAAMSDDLNTAGAIAELHNLAGKGDLKGLLASAQLMGLLTPELGGWFRFEESYHALRMVYIARAKARESKDYVTSDIIRNSLKEFGFTGKDLPDGKVGSEVDYLRAREVWHTLALAEKREFLRMPEYVDGQSVDGNAFMQAYQTYVAAKVMERLL